MRHTAIVIGCLAIASCDPSASGSVDGKLANGTWGGDNAAVIVVDSLVHVHIGCTDGDVTGRVTLDADGRFTIAGSYLLRAYPIAVGPTLPAVFTGRLDGAKLTFTVFVTDTTDNDKVTVLGPVTVVLGKDPQMGPCPICKDPLERRRVRQAAMRAAAAEHALLQSTHPHR
jgi:hypothetical protein